MLELSSSPLAAGADPVAQRSALAPESFVADFQTSKRSAGDVLEALEQVIVARKGGDGSRSYTARLLAGGVEVAGAKVTEEAREFVQAAEAEADERVVSEAADLFYHAMVLLACRDVSLDQVAGELSRRFGVSGLAEKAARASGGGNG